MRWESAKAAAFFVVMFLGLIAPLAVAKPLSVPPKLPPEERLVAESFNGLYVRDCNAFARRKPCDLSGDLDGDGKLERVFKIRERKRGKVGIGVAWPDGRFSVLGAGARTPHVVTDVDEEATQQRASTRPLELDGIMTWQLLRPTRGGFSASAGAVRMYRAPSVVGQGIFYSGGDAAEMIYWDGRRWRWLILGF